MRTVAIGSAMVFVVLFATPQISFSASSAVVKDGTPRVPPAFAAVITREMTMRRLLTQAWDEADEGVLTRMISEHEPVWRIARKLQRSESSVRDGIVKLGLRISPQAPTLRAVFGTSPRNG